MESDPRWEEDKNKRRGRMVPEQLFMFNKQLERGTLLWQGCGLDKSCPHAGSEFVKDGSSNSLQAKTHESGVPSMSHIRN